MGIAELALIFIILLIIARVWSVQVRRSRIEDNRMDDKKKINRSIGACNIHACER